MSSLKYRWNAWKQTRYECVISHVKRALVLVNLKLQLYHAGIHRVWLRGFDVTVEIVCILHYNGMSTDDCLMSATRAENREINSGFNFSLNVKLSKRKRLIFSKSNSRLYIMSALFCNLLFELYNQLFSLLLYI